MQIKLKYVKRRKPLKHLMHFLVCVRCAVDVNSFSSCAFPSRSRGAWYPGRQEKRKTSNNKTMTAVWLSSVAQSCLTLCDPKDCNMPGFPIHHRPPELAQTHVHQVGDAIQPSHNRLTPSPPAFNLSQHQDLFQGVSSPPQAELQLQHQSFQWIFRTDFL